MTERRYVSATSLIVVACVGAALLDGTAAAADLSPPTQAIAAPVAASPFGILSEVRGGVLAHSLYGDEFGSVDINGEILFNKLYTSNDPFWNYFIPRLHVGGNLNSAGQTSDVYAGATWRFPVYQKIFGEVTFGGDYNDGFTGTSAPPGRNAIGCEFAFRESLSFGYALSQHWNVMAIVSHFSNAHLCIHNAGVTDAGLRLGYQF